MNKSKIIVSFLVVASMGAPLALQKSQDGSPTIEVFKTSTCHCCGKWIDLLKGSEQAVRVQNVADVTPIKRQHHVPATLRSCHTTIAGGYVFEGHVPIDLMRRVLDERPAIAGLAVPGMPVGSPGMEMPGRKDPYKVIAFHRDGTSQIYAER